MSLPSTGTISLKDIQNEFGGSNPISLSEYYKNGPYVTATDYAPNVPTSGTISLSNFYGAKKNTLQTVILTSGSSWTAPSTVIGSLSVLVVGGGGGGGTGTARYHGSSNGGGGGGGNGGVVSDTVSVTPGTTYTYIIGSAGSGAAAGSAGAGAAGSNTTIFGSVSYTHLTLPTNREV